MITVISSIRSIFTKNNWFSIIPCKSNFPLSILNIRSTWNSCIRKNDYRRLRCRRGPTMTTTSIPTITTIDTTAHRVRRTLRRTSILSPSSWAYVRRLADVRRRFLLTKSENCQKKPLKKHQKTVRNYDRILHGTFTLMCEVRGWRPSRNKTLISK